MALDRQLGFPARVRVRRKREIDHVFQNATLRKTYGPIVITGVENKLGFPRLGLAIAKRHVRKAVVRNKVKRAIREWFRNNQSEIICFDLMVSLRQGLTSPKHVRSWLSRALTALKRSC